MSSLASDTSRLLIGFGEADITPPFPHPMAGFGQARTACHTGVHDPIAARAVIFESSGETVALVSCEVIGLKAEIIEEIRKAIPSHWQLAPERLVITCTHTHGAPVIGEPYVAFLVARIIQALSQARADRKLRYVEVGRATHEEWVGFNRRKLECGFLPVDREVSYLVIREDDEKMRGILFHYACHPSILGPDNLLITADWPGYTRRALQQNLGADVTVLYLKGTEGDINTGYSAGISSLGIRIPTRTYETAEGVGVIIATTILGNLRAATLIEHPAIQISTAEKELAYRSIQNLGAAREMLARCAHRIDQAILENERPDCVLAARVEHAYAGFEIAALEFILAADAPVKRVQQTAFRIGSAGFLSLPGEFFVESGLRIKREALSEFTFPLGITGDYLGYIPPGEAFAEGGYEVASARFAPTTAEAWCTSGIALLNSLF